MELPRNRPVVAVATGCELEGCARPQADPNDVEGTKKAVCKRGAMKPPQRCPQMMGRFYDFVRRWVRKNYLPIDPDYDFSIEAWLAKTHYPEWRKVQLKKDWENVSNPWHKKFTKIKGFVKDEAYDDWKYLRLINPRHDIFKCLVGPVFKAIEEVVFKNPVFVKGIPRDKWPEHIMERFISNYETLANDFEAYEAHATAEMQEAEFIVYEYLLSRTMQNPSFVNLCRRVFGGDQEMYYKWFIVVMKAIRASGDQQTSLGNALINYLSNAFLAEELGSVILAIAVEGDDSISQWRGTKPTSEDFARLGLTAKVEVHASPETASFCGLIFDPVDRINIGDPLKMMAKLGWSPRCYMKSKRAKLNMLSKAKAYSMLYQFAGCPIISKMAQWVIRCTKHIDLRPLLNSGNLNEYERENLVASMDAHKRLIEVSKRQPKISTRMLMETKFGISIPRQLAIEQWFDEAKQLQPIPGERVIDIVPQSWVGYWDRYVHVTKLDENFDIAENM